MAPGPKHEGLAGRLEEGLPGLPSGPGGDGLGSASPHGQAPSHPGAYPLPRHWPPSPAYTSGTWATRGRQRGLGDRESGSFECWGEMGDDEPHPSSPGRCHEQGSGLRTRSGMSPLRNRRPRGVTGSTLGSGAPASSIFTLWAQMMPRAGPGWATLSRAWAVGLWQLSGCSFRAAIYPVSIVGFPSPAWDADRALGPQPGL